jgi:hypothetical protein
MYQSEMIFMPPELGSFIERATKLFGLRRRKLYHEMRKNGLD